MLDIHDLDMKLAAQAHPWNSENGLDPDDVYAFIGALIDQNAELASRLNHLHSIPDFANMDDAPAFIAALINQNAELAGRLSYLDSIPDLVNQSMLQATEQAKHVVKQILKEMDGKASAIFLEISHRARAEADTILAEAEEKAEHAGKEIINQAIRQGQAIIEAAVKRSQAIKTGADAETGKTTDEAPENLYHSPQHRRQLSERETQLTPEKGLGTPREEGPFIERGAKQLVEGAKKPVSSPLERKLKAVYDQCLSATRSIGGTQKAEIESETRYRKPPNAKPSVFQTADRPVCERIQILVRWLSQSSRTVIFTGAGISTASGLPDFRGPDGLWKRQAKGLTPPQVADWLGAQPNAAHLAIVELQNMRKLQFLISQNVDDLHLKSGIRHDLLAELHGNIFKSCCRACGTRHDASSDSNICPRCGGRLVSTVVNFGEPIPQKEWDASKWHSQHCELFIVVGSSLAVKPACTLPRMAVNAGANLVIINESETLLDRLCGLRFKEKIVEVLPAATFQLKDLLQKSRRWDRCLNPVAGQVYG